jgi:hypothetical protein
MKPILCVLQNAYGRGSRLKSPVYTTSSINRKNATYSRIVPHLEKDFKMFFTECSPILANNHKDKFPTDHRFLKSALDHTEWFKVIAFGQQAEAAIKTLRYKNVIFLPHPVSFKWRKSLILDLKEKLITESLNP